MRDLVFRSVIDEEKGIEMSLFGNYVNCPICGNLHDDGPIVRYRGRELFICFDCEAIVDGNVSELRRSETFEVSRQDAERRMRIAGWPEWEIEEELASMFGAVGADGAWKTGSFGLLAENNRRYRLENGMAEAIVA